MSETNIMRLLGISALMLALIVTIAITVNAGIFGGESSDAGEPASPAAAGNSSALDTQADAPPPAEVPAEAPAAAADADAPITLETQTYIIEGGDSFFSIATKFDTTIDELQRLNPSVNPQNLSPGAELAVPKQPAAE